MGIDDKTGKGSGIYVYDNTLCIPNPGEGVIEVYNLLGEKIATGKTQGEPMYRMSLNLTSGYYIAKLTTSSRMKTQKVFIH
ncbi:MAG: T9SS type A sorting domain-containing protein [Bacteroidota bacterium]